MNKERLWSPIFISIIVCALFCFLVGQGSNAGTTVYLETVGSSTGLAGVGALFFSVAAAVSRIFAGPFADLRGRRNVIFIGAIIMLVGSLGPLLNNDGFLFIIWRILQGFGFAAATTACATAAADVLPLTRLGEGIGYYGLAQAISMSIGPALAIFLISTDPPENFYIGLGVCALMSLILAAFCRYEKKPENLPKTAEFRVRWEKGEVSYLNDSKDAQGAVKITPKALIDSILEPAALAGTIPLMFIASAFCFSIFFMGVFGRSIGVENSGAYYTISAISMIVIRLVSGKFMDKARPIFIMGAAVFFGVICFGMMLACSLFDLGGATEWVFYLAGIPYGICMGIGIPINQTIAVRMTPPERWGAANGLFYFGTDVSMGLFSLLFGFLVGILGYPITLGIVIACVLLSFVAALVCYPKEKV